MLEITGEDIAALVDDDLRALVARLCEAEMRKRGLPSAAVTWGGAQEAPDGGIDVRVSLDAGAVIDGFVPRPACGFQVKKPDVPASGIADEMRPGGTIRPSIQDLADKGGAYIIVSGNGSTADEALRRRREAMAAAVKDISNGATLALDFYDRTRVATWLGDHPGLVPRVRERAGRPIAGWQSYGPWANPAEGIAGEYLADDSARIRTGTRDGDQGVSATEGINRIREQLAQTGKSVRLVGLAGVGKTRFAQALFDTRVGANSLDPALALYSNLGDRPDPTPVAMISQLVAARTRAIVVVDNCSSDLHRRLTEVGGSVGSSVSLLTVEYDIREDQPEATLVFEMEPSSVAMTEKLVRKRFPSLSQVDAGTIAEFAGGNARIAIALAGTVQRGESLAGLADEALFGRLFHQNHQPDADLLRAAQACALVYSLDGEDTGDDGELMGLGKLVGQGAAGLYAQLAELRRRDLVQARGVWRAVLPHAIANRLAKLALKNIPPALVESQLGAGAPGRIKKSFSRRLGYLHDDSDGARIVERWLSPGGILGDAAELDDLHAEMFRNVAPVAPEAVLTALERVAVGPRSERLLARRGSFVRLLRSLAYEPKLFERCTALLASFAAFDDDGEKSDAGKSFTSLFFAYLSGTHAPVRQRILVMEGLIRSGEPRRQTLGLGALGALLESSHFTSSYDFRFGARSRDHGYHPNFRQVQAWYAAVLASAVGLGAPSVAEEVRGIIGARFRGLWTHACLYDDLERVTRAVTAEGYWREGWIAARQTLISDGAGMTPEAKARLVTLERELRPKNLVQKVRSIVLSRTLGRIDLEEYEEDDPDPGNAHARTEALAENLGEELAADEEAFRELLPELARSSSKLASLGAGLAKGTTDRCATWERLVAAFAACPEEKRGGQVLKGFLRRLGNVDPTGAGELLEAAIDHPVLGARFPELQYSVSIDKAGVERLRRSLVLGLAPADSFVVLAWGRCHETLDAVDLKDLVERIGQRSDGINAALAIVFFRLHADKDKSREHEPEMIEAGRTLLGKLELESCNAHEDHQLGLLVAACLTGTAGASVAKSLCKRVKRVAATHYTRIGQHHDLFEALCRVQPHVVLDAFFGGDEGEPETSARLMSWFGEHRGNPLAAISEDEMIAWCDCAADMRYVRMASVAPYLRGLEEEAASQWSGVALKLIERAPDPVMVVRTFTERFRPQAWSGSRAAILEGRTGLLTQLEEHADPRLVAFATEERQRLAGEIEEERRCEAEQERRTGERFE